MPPERWKRAKEVFTAAIDYTGSDRDAFLRRECAGDEELEREVYLLFRHHNSPHELLATSPLWRNEQTLESPLTLTDGGRFGKYIVLRAIGRGGMGDVYLAEDTKLHRRVALKLLPSALNMDFRAIARFEQEALAASALNHPNVPVVYEADEADGRRYIATEFVQGTNLSERLAHGPLDWPLACSIAIQVGRALEAAHAAGIIHRDVKPGNILIREDGAVKLADFGIAKLLERNGSAASPGSITDAGGVIGTPAYMSPEQLAGQRVDARTDIWSLGTVLHEMILGYSPSSAEKGLRSSCLSPPQLSRIMQRAIERNPYLRYATMGEFLADLDSVMKLSDPARLASNRYAIYGIAAILLTAFYFLVAPPRAVDAEIFQAGRISKLTTSGKVVEAAISPDDRYVLYVVNDSGQQSVRLRELATGADIQRIKASSLIYSDLTFAPDGNSFYYLVDENRDLRTLYHAPLTGGAPVKVIEDVDSPPAISPDGRRIEFMRGYPANDETALFVASADGRDLRKIASRPYARAFLSGGASWSADGKSIMTAVFTAPQQAMLLEVRISDGSQQPLGKHAWRWIGRLSSIAGGRGLVFPAAGPESISPQIYQMSLRSHKVNAITTDLASYRKISASPHDIVAVQEDSVSAIWITSLQDPSLSHRITPPAGRYWQLAWMPDGSLLSQTGAGRELNVWRFFPDGSRQQVTSGPYIDWSTVASADGKRLAFVSNRGGGLHLWTSDSEGHFIRQLTRGSGVSSSPSFLPDGSIVYCETISGASGIYKISPDGGSPLRIVSAEACRPMVSPDGKYIACELKEPNEAWQMVIVELRTAQLVRRFRDIPYGADRRWTADSRAVAYATTHSGVTNIVLRFLADDSKKPLTSFGEDSVFSFDIARNGQELACVRGIAVSDVIVIERAH